MLLTISSLSLNKYQEISCEVGRLKNVNFLLYLQTNQVETCQGLQGSKIRLCGLGDQVNTALVLSRPSHPNSPN